MTAWAQAHELQVTGQARFSGSANGGTHGRTDAELLADDHAARVAGWRDKVRALRDGELREKERKVLDFLATVDAIADVDRMAHWRREGWALNEAIGDEWADRFEAEAAYFQGLIDSRDGTGPEAA